MNFLARILLAFFILSTTTGCVSLNDVYNKKPHHRAEIKEFCESVDRDYEMNKAAMSDCIVKASLVERENVYEKLNYWFAYGPAILWIPMLSLLIVVLGNR